MAVVRLALSICRAISSGLRTATFIVLRSIIGTTVWLARRENLFGGLTEIGGAAATLKLVNRNLEHAENNLLLLGRQTSLERTAAFLLEMDQRLEQPALMILPMRRRDIADYLGLTLETVS